MKIYKVLIIVFLTVCCSTSRNPSTFDEWTGIYESVENEGSSWSFELKITKDSCWLSGIGIQLYFEDLCKTEKTGDTLFIYYLKNIEGNHIGKMQKDVNYINKLFKRKGKYYISSIGMEISVFDELEMKKR
jgi:hypothetical protein